jgi:hypothetical protein
VSWLSLLFLVDRAVIEEIGVRVVAVDFEHFRDVAASGPAFDLNDDMERVSDIAFNGAVRELDTALQRAAREPSKTLFGRVRMNGGQCPRMNSRLRWPEIKPNRRTGPVCSFEIEPLGIFKVVVFPEPVPP